MCLLNSHEAPAPCLSPRPKDPTLALQETGPLLLRVEWWGRVGRFQSEQRWDSTRDLVRLIRRWGRREEFRVWLSWMMIHSLWWGSQQSLAEPIDVSSTATGPDPDGTSATSGSVLSLSAASYLTLVTPLTAAHQTSPVCWPPLGKNTGMWPFLLQGIFRQRLNSVLCVLANMSMDNLMSLSHLGSFTLNEIGCNQVSNIRILFSSRSALVSIMVKFEGSRLLYISPIT